MQDKYSAYAIPVIILAAIVGLYCIFTSFFFFKGTSSNGMWEANYEKYSYETGDEGWTLTVTQIDDSYVIVKKIELYDNSDVLMTRTDFKEYIDIDATVYTLHPFSYPKFYGTPPKLNHHYTVIVQWEDPEGKSFEDIIPLKY